MNSERGIRWRRAGVRAGVLLTALGLAGAAPARTLGDPPVTGLLARAELGGAGGSTLVLALEGGAPWSTALLCLEGAQGPVLQPVQLDGAGRYRRELPARELSAALRLSFRAQAAPVASGAWQSSNFVHVPGLPAAGGAALGGGQVVICEIMKNPTAVPDSAGEWVEVYNAGDAVVNLEGCSISDLGSNFHVISNGGAGLLLLPGARLVLGNNDDPTLNGGVPVDYRYSSFTLSNSADDVLLHTPGGGLMDGVHYEGTTAWPNTPGVSMSLNGLAHDPVLNDYPAVWCDAQTPFAPGNPDLGTPGQRNAVCP